MTLIRLRNFLKDQKILSANSDTKTKKISEHGDRSPRDVTAINSAFKLPFLAAVNKGKLIQIKIQFALSPIPLWSEDTRYPLEDVEAR